MFLRKGIRIMNNKNYAGIDCFRVISALLIVAIHTSPLADFSETGDFILTRIIARIAVPFFMMTSGFFMFYGYPCNTKKLTSFVKKTLLLYLTAILIYIPINIYNGYFRMDNLLPNIIKDIVFDGTLYHLWYLPASVIGALTAWYLVKRFDYSKALIITFILWVVGLFGDSYYGLAEKIYGVKYFYKLIFQISDYTRNGIFYAPVFFVLGGIISANSLQKNIKIFKKSIFGFLISFFLMVTEALLLHHFELQRHDSMYLSLLPCMWFLFFAILYFSGRRLEYLRNLSLIIYIIHPMMIVVIRMFAKLFNMQKLLADNNLVHFIIVCLASVAFGVLMLLLTDRYKTWSIKHKKQIPHDSGKDRAWVEIDFVNLEHNVRVLKSAMAKKCELMAVVKAEAYGHGMYEIATHLNSMGVKAFAVATIDEGIRLRRYGIRGEILILGYTVPYRAKELFRYNLTQTLTDYDYAVYLNEQGVKVKTHIKVDTGMHRLGFDKDDIEKISCVFEMKFIKVCGIYTHLCVSDSLEEKDVYYTNMQISAFYKLLDSLKKKGITIPKIHIQSSYGLLNYPELQCDYVRAGVSLYGVLSSARDKTKLNLDLRPVLSLKAKIILLRKIKKGDSVGYGRSFVTERDSVIAILPVGYADGFPRNLSCGKSYVLINGKKAPVAGKICMDQLAVDVTDIDDVKVGMIATLIGRDGIEEIISPMVADASESISNELLSRMGQRLRL